MLLYKKLLPMTFGTTLVYYIPHVTPDSKILLLPKVLLKAWIAQLVS